MIAEYLRVFAVYNCTAMSTPPCDGTKAKSHLSLEPVVKTSNADKIKLMVKFCILCAVITVVWFMFMLPIIFYHLPQESAGTESTSEMPAMIGSLIANTTINCSERFSLSSQTGLCSPVCGEWEEFPHEVVVAFDVITALLYIFHLIGTGIALAFSCYNYKIMYKFPSVLLVYFLLSPIIFDITYLIGLAGRDALFCRSSDLLETIENSTPFCSFTGIVNNFVFAMVDFWWLFHTIILFWKVQFPVHAKQFQYNKFLHVIIIVIALTFPIIPIGVAFGTGGYIITAFPPLNNCFARNPAASFYPFILPKCVIFPVGISITLITIWKLSRIDLLHSKQNNNYTAEIKLLGVFLYFSLAVTISLTLFTLASRKASQQQQGFARYFFCEAIGSDQCILEVDRRGDQAFTVISFAMFAFAPYVTLIYIIPAAKLKDKWRSWKSKSTEDTQNEAK